MTVYGLTAFLPSLNKPITQSLTQGVRLCVFGEVSGGKKDRGKTTVVKAPVARCHAVR